MEERSVSDGAVSSARRRRQQQHPPPCHEQSTLHEHGAHQQQHLQPCRVLLPPPQQPQQPGGCTGLPASGEWAAPHNPQGALPALQRCHGHQLSFQHAGPAPLWRLYASGTRPPDAAAGHPQQRRPGRSRLHEQSSASTSSSRSASHPPGCAHHPQHHDWPLPPPSSSPSSPPHHQHQQQQQQQQQQRQISTAEEARSRSGPQHTADHRTRLKRRGTRHRAPSCASWPALLLPLLAAAALARGPGAAVVEAALPFKGCPYGTLPGSWDRGGPVGLKWRLVQPATAAQAPTPQSALAVREAAASNRTDCWRMEPLLARMQNYERQRFASMTTPSALEDPRSRQVLEQSQHPPKWVRAPTHMYQRWHPLVLLMGDHHDKWMAQDACQFLRGLKPGAMQHLPRYPDLSEGPDDDEKQHRYMYFTVCENGAASIASRYVPGVSPQGPYHKQDELVGVSSPNASWPARTDETLSLFSRYFRREPDLVVLHANYWDIYRVPWQQGEHALWLRRGLPKVFLDGWKQQMTAWVKHVRRSVPHDTLIVLRTAILPKTNAQGQPYLPHVGGPLPIIQLNEATRVVARQLKVPLLDCEMHTRELDPRQVIRDNLSPSRWINLEWVNMLLNMLAQHSPNHFSHVTPHPHHPGGSGTGVPAGGHAQQQGAAGVDPQQQEQRQQRNSLFKQLRLELARVENRMGRRRGRALMGGAVGPGREADACEAPLR